MLLKKISENTLVQRSHSFLTTMHPKNKIKICNFPCVTCILKVNTKNVVKMFCLEYDNKTNVFDCKKRISLKSSDYYWPEDHALYPIRKANGPGQ